jgi:hypothetical protein
VLKVLVSCFIPAMATLGFDMAYRWSLGLFGFAGGL